MSNSPTVPIIDPQGKAWDIPYEKMHDALSQGGKMGVYMKDPEGKQWVIPADKTQDAVKAGGTIVPYNLDQSHQKEGFWSALGGDLGNMLKGALELPSRDPSKAGENKLNPMNAARQFNASNQQLTQEDAARKVAGRSLPYRVGAPIAEAAGANVPGMEQAAANGDPNAVMGHAVAPLVPIAAGEALGAGISKATKVGQEAAPGMYRSALKPSTRLSPTKVERMVQTGLTEKIPVSAGGVEKLADLVDDLNTKIADQIGNGKGATVNPRAVAQRTDALKSRFANQVNPTADLQAIDASKQEFLQNNPQPISAADAQSMKQGTYQQLGSKAYGEMKTSTIEAQKALARGLKEELVTAFPELKNLNAAESKLLDLQPVLEKAVQRIGNHQLVGIGTPVVAGTVKAVTGSGKLAAVLGTLKAVVDHPMVKSRIAIALNHAGVPMAAATARVAGYATALSQGAADNASQPADGQPTSRQ